MTERIRIGISPCPNDTFAFHGLLERAVPTPGIELAIELADVEELNRRFAAGALDAAKCSFHAALRMAREAVVLPAGAALGFGVGPVLLAGPAWSGESRRARVLCPGQGTTAHLLYRLFHAGEGRVEHAVFSEILPRLARGEADLGACIHEARFTYERHGLRLVEDLGATWESRTGAPLPLGGVLARRAIPPRALASLARAVRASIAHARAHPDLALATMRRHAREMEDGVLWKHVELYVGEWTSDLGSEGRRALAALGEAARASGLVPADLPPLEVLDVSVIPGEPAAGPQAP